MSLPLTGLKYVKGQAPDWSKQSETVYVVEFWATWCGPCRQTIPHVSEIAQKYKDKGLEVIGVTNEQNESQINGFVSQMGPQMNYTVAIEDGTLSRDFMQAYNVRGIPHAFVIGKDGKVAWNGHPAEPDFESAIQTALNQSFGPDPKTLSHDDLLKLGVRDLKKILARGKVDYSDCVEKIDLVSKIEKHLK